MRKQIKLEVVKGVEGYSISTFDNKIGGTRIAGPKPWGGGEVVHSFTCDVDELLRAIKVDSYIE